MSDDLQASFARTQQMLDDAANISALERLRLVRRLSAVKDQMAGGQVAGLVKLKLSRELLAIRDTLGARAAAAQPVPVEKTPDEVAEAEAQAIADGEKKRASTADLYAFDESRGMGARKRENRDAESLLAQIDSGEVKPPLTPEQKAVLAKYSGLGGNLEGADGNKGSGYEYYTPKPIASATWDLLRELGFGGGRVLDPAAGVGIFGATAPTDAAVDAVELSPVSGRINQLVNDGPGYRTTVSPFEAVAAATPDGIYDAVVTNVPFGKELDARGGNQLKDPKYQKQPMEAYFLLRSMEKLRPNGLAAFIVPPRVVSEKGGRMAELRERMSFMGEFLGAYRLPNSVFGVTSADTITDLVVFRKFSREVLDKVAELSQQNMALLVQANVLWQDFLNGDYFKTPEGLRHMLGKFVAKDPNKYRDVDRVVHDGTTADIARLLRKFPGSRIDWAALDAAETEPIVYRDGDTMNHAGQTLQLQGGRWVVLGNASLGQDADEVQSLDIVESPLAAIKAGLKFDAAVAIIQGLIQTARELDCPTWLRAALKGIEGVAPSGRALAWDIGLTGLGVAQAIEEKQAETEGFDYLKGFPKLSERMERHAVDAANPPRGMLGNIKAALKAIAPQFKRGKGFSDFWLGRVVEYQDERQADEKFAAERYQAGEDGYVPVETARQLFGAEFDPHTSDDWCISADGARVAKADDYYVGPYGEFLTRIDAEIAAAPTDAIRQKLLRQKIMADSRVARADPSRMSFTLNSPWVTMEEKAEFLRRFVDRRFVVGVSETNSKGAQILFDANPKTDREKLLQRLALHLNGTALGLGGAKVANEKAAMKALRELAATTEAQFNTWAKASPVVTKRMNDRVNDAGRLYFKQVDDDSPLEIPGIRTDTGRTPHGYQNAFVRRMGREFAGINGDGVGLGKTLQCLLAVQHAHSIGTKRRTLIVVPNAVLSNWRKEVLNTYTDTSDCLFVGLRDKKGGGFTTNSSAYDEDLNAVLTGRYRKIFMTMEALARMRLRSTTVDQYDEYLASVDATYRMSDSNKANEKTKSLREKLKEQLLTGDGKSMGAPFFEDMGIDSMALDEAHAMKNSRGAVEYKSAKFLSLADPSGRGMDAQAKAWYVRKGNRRGDGVLLLTATPITNSPLEIYSMLSLAVGDKKLGDMMAGISGADEFLKAMCVTESREEETLDGKLKDYNVFTDLANVAMLRTALGLTVTARTAEEVGAQIVVPTADESPIHVALPDSTKDTLIEYKDAFRFAIDTLSGKKDVGGSQDAFMRVQAKFGESDELIGHPFNLISKMTALILDPELDERATFYTILAMHQDKADAAVAAWNKKAPVEVRARETPHTSEGAVVGTKKIKDGEDEVELLKIKAMAKRVGDRLILDSLEPTTQNDFEAALEAAGVDLDCTIPPKLAAMIANFQLEEAHPRGVIDGNQTPRVRQLIFCDMLPLHAKIKRLLVKRCGVPAGSIAIITGKVNGKPEEILAVQDGFNADDENNRYRVVIANEKAEVGINLQQGTQAIHHLTIGWTPDSLTQRNGRGVRQGNQTGFVKVYHYEAGGTFDSYKKKVVSNKSAWIDEVSAPDGADTVKVSGGLSREQQMAMIDRVGADDGAMARLQQEDEAKERMARAQGVRAKQAVAIGTIIKQQTFLNSNQWPVGWVADILAQYSAVRSQIGVLQGKVSSEKTKPAALLKFEGLLAEYKAREQGIRRQLDQAVTVTKSGMPSSVDELMRRAVHNGKKGERDEDVISREVRRGVYGFEVNVSDESDLYADYMSEVEFAKSMVNQAKKDFAALSDQDGGVAAEVADRAATGQAVVLGGAVYSVGSLTQDANGRIGVVYRQSGGAQRFCVAYWSEAGDLDHNNPLVNVIDGGAVVHAPGASEYTGLCQAAAELEDGFPAGVREGLNDYLPSALVPDVARLRKGVTSVQYRSSSYDSRILGAPYFPVVFPHTGWADDAVVVPRIVAEQKAVVQNATGNTLDCVFSAAVDAPVTKGAVPNVWKILLDYAKANGLKLTRGDFEFVNKGRYGSLSSVQNKGASSLSDIASAATSVADLEAKAFAWVRDELGAYFDMQGAGLLNGTAEDALKALESGEVYFFKSRRRYLQEAEAKAAEDARKAEAGELPEPAAAVAPAAAAPAPEPAQPGTDGPDMSDPEAWVGISGAGTKRWKDDLKRVALSTGRAAVWDGDALTWNIQAKSWEAFMAAHPSAVGSLNAGPPTGKLSYKRR